MPVLRNGCGAGGACRTRCRPRCGLLHVVPDAEGAELCTISVQRVSVHGVSAIGNYHPASPVSLCGVERAAAAPNNYKSVLAAGDLDDVTRADLARVAEGLAVVGVVDAEHVLAEVGGVGGAACCGVARNPRGLACAP